MMAVAKRKKGTRPLPAAPAPAFTKPLALLLASSAALAVGLYLHSVNVEGTSNRHQLEIKQLRNSNLHLQLELATVQAPQTLETQAQGLAMGPAAEVVYLPAFVPPVPALRPAVSQEALAPLVGY